MQTRGLSRVLRVNRTKAEVRLLHRGRETQHRSVAYHRASRAELAFCCSVLGVILCSSKTIGHHCIHFLEKM